MIKGSTVDRWFLRSAPVVGRAYELLYFAGIIWLAFGVAVWAAGVWAVLGLGLAGFYVALLDEVKNPPAKITEDSVVLGMNLRDHHVPLGYDQLAAHGLLVGASGSGKTTTLLTILCQAITRGLPVVAIDLKGSQSFAQELHAACHVAGRQLAWWRLEGPHYWNPLQHGDASELKDKLITAERFTEPHYQRAAERYLQTAIQVLQQARPDKPVTLAAVTNLLEPENLQRLLPHIPRDLAVRVGQYLNNLTRDQRSAIMGIQSRLAILTESAAGEYLQPGPPGKTIDLARPLLGAGSEVVLFSLNSSRNPRLAAQIAAVAIQDLIAASGYRVDRGDLPLALVAIDEFSAIDTDNLLALIARARGARISVMLSTQELADLERLAEGFRDQVLGNTAVLIAHRQNVPDSAELIARMIGTATVWKTTHQVAPPAGIVRRLMLGTKPRRTGRGTVREVEEFKIHPNLIKELPTGIAVLVTKTPRASAEVFRIDPWTPPETDGHSS